jgi:CO/xanthine dehydrogenase FAD-binding subunit
MDLPFVEALVPADPTAWREGDAWLAGGTWLFSEAQPGIRRLLDLHALGWESLRGSPAGLELAATCTLAELAAFDPPARWPAGRLLRLACEALLGSFKVWNEATVGGNLCLALPAGPMAALTASLDGICTVWAPDGGVSELPAVEFVTGDGRTVLRRGELLRSVLLPERSLRSPVAFRQASRTPRGRSAALVIARHDREDGEFVLTVTASVQRPWQLRFESLPDSAELADALRGDGPGWLADAHGTPAWRAHMTRLLAEQVREELA